MVKKSLPFARPLARDDPSTPRVDQWSWMPAPATPRFLSPSGERRWSAAAAVSCAAVALALGRATGADGRRTRCWIAAGAHPRGALSAQVRPHEKKGALYFTNALSEILRQSFPSGGSLPWVRGEVIDHPNQYLL